MGKIWTILMLSSVSVSILSGRAGAASAALLDSAGQAVTFLMTLLAAMTMWGGLMEILREAGDVERVGRLLRRVGSRLFPGLEDEACWAQMSMNLSANLLGLGNAATPAGVRAAQLLSRQGEAGMRALAMLLVMDNAAVQLLPTTVITLRQAAGAASPADIWWPTLLVSGVSSGAGILMMALLQRGGAHRERRFGGCCGRDDRPDHSEGLDAGE